MKEAEFKKFWERALTVDVANDDLFLTAGYFWINLTELQQQKMCGLLKSQGNEVKNGCIYLANGLGIACK